MQSIKVVGSIMSHVYEALSSWAKHYIMTMKTVCSNEIRVKGTEAKSSLLTAGVKLWGHGHLTIHIGDRSNIGAANARANK